MKQGQRALALFPIAWVVGLAALWAAGWIQLWSPSLAHPVGPLDPYLQSLTLGPAQFMSLLITYGGVFALGSVAGRALLRPGTVHEATRSIACFGLGYLMTVAIVRLLSGAVPHALIFPSSIGTLAVLTLYLGLRERGPSRTAESRSWRTLFGIGTVFAVLLVFSLLLTFQPTDEMHRFTGHGKEHYAWFLDTLQYASMTGKFPFFPQHYDELIFNYLLMAGRVAPFDPVLFYWITNSLMKTTVLFLIFALGRRSGLSPSRSILMTAFLGYANFGLQPTGYALLFDSHNPVSIILHPGRVLAPILPLAILVPLLEGDTQAGEEYPQSRFALWVLGAIGLTALPIEAAFFVIAAVSISWLALGMNPPSTSDRRLRSLRLLMCLGLACVLLPYAYRKSDSTHGVEVLLSAALIVGCLGGLLRRFGWRRALPSDPLAKRRMLGPAVAALAAGGLALLLLGNCIAPDFARRIGWNRPFFYFPSAIPLVAGTTRYFTRTQCFRDFIYCADTRQFLIGYGLILGAAWTGAWVYLEDSPRRSRLYLLSLLGWMGVLALCLFGVDFTEQGLFPWVKSRFLEGPVYLVFFFFFHSFANRSGRSAHWTLAALTTWTCVTFIQYWPLSRLQFQADFILRSLAKK